MADDYDVLTSPDEQGDEGSPSLLGASEPSKDVSGGGQITNFVRGLADTGGGLLDTGGKVVSLVNQFRNPTASAATQKAKPAPPAPTVPTQSWFSQYKNYILGGAALVLVVVLVFSIRRRRS